MCFGNYSCGKIKDIKEILQKNINFGTNSLKKRLIKENYFEHKCYKCNLTEWNGKPIPIELEHINGDRFDNTIENLTILCPNCHAQTETYRGKNKQKLEKNLEVRFLSKRDKEKQQETKTNRIEKNLKEVALLNDNKEKIIEQVSILSVNQVAQLYKVSYYTLSKFCKDNNIKTVKIFRSFQVTKEELQSLIETKSFVQIGKMFGVSDNAIRKRCQNLGIDIKQGAFSKHRNNKLLNSVEKQKQKTIDDFIIV